VLAERHTLSISELNNSRLRPSAKGKATLLHSRTARELLSGREQLIVCLVAAGMSDADIARETGMAEAEVRSKLLIIFRKLAEAGLLGMLLYAGEKKFTDSLLASCRGQAS
jgi:DNA-binding NarL/FixJ family response regulator